MIHVHLLGRFGVDLPAGELALPTVKVRLLAAYLFWQQGRWLTRELLRDLLWGDATALRSAGSLRTALCMLRKSLAAGGAPPGLLEIRRDAVRAVSLPDCSIDAQDFETRARTALRSPSGEIAALVAAASLYRGSFLADSDAQWCLPERQRLADLHVSLLRTLAERLTALGLFDMALTYARNWVEPEPLDEGAHRALMQIYGALGQPAQVTRQFETCRRLLRTELSVDPDPETLRLHMRLTGADAPAPAQLRRRRTGRPRRLAQRLSSDPLRNARLLMVFGERAIQQGKAEAGLAAVKRAVRIYDRFGGVDESAQARLLFAQTLMAVRSGPQATEAAAFLEPALAHFRRSGPASSLAAGLLIAADAAWFLGRHDRCVAYTVEGATVAHALGDRELEMRLVLLRAVALRDSHQLARARKAFADVQQSLPGLTNDMDMLLCEVNLGIWLTMVGDLAGAERFLQEGLTLIGLIPDRIRRLKYYEAMVLGMLITVLHYRDRHAEIAGFHGGAVDAAGSPEPARYIAMLFSGDGAGAAEHRTMLQGIDAWLRVSLSRLTPGLVLPTMRMVVEQLLADGLLREARRWSAVAIRIARRWNWTGGAALFYCFRAVALAQAGQVGAARVCRRRAEQTADAGDRWVPPWLARADGWTARADGAEERSRICLAKAAHLFERLGDHYDARCVRAEISTR